MVSEGLRALAYSTSTRSSPDSGSDSGKESGAGGITKGVTVGGTSTIGVSVGFCVFAPQKTDESIMDPTHSHKQIFFFIEIPFL